MQIKFKGKRLAVEKIKKQNKRAGGSLDGFLVMPESEEYVGVIRYLGDEIGDDFAVGQKVYFSTEHQLMRIGGIDLCVMDEKSILAVVYEEEIESKA